MKVRKVMSSSLPDINNYKTRTDILKLVARQLEKDLNLNQNLDVPQVPLQAFEKLKKQVEDVLKQMLLEGFNFKELMYRIDVSEKKIRTAFALESNVDELELYARLIVEREMQKVITRLYFSNQLEQ
jgi:hypothetical protein